MNIIQIGCNDGKDHVFDFIKQNQQNINKLILIDANINCIEVCKEKYKDIPNVEYLHCAIMPNNQEYVNFYIPDNNELTNGHSSTLLSHLKNLNYSKVKEIKTPSKNLNSLFKEFNFKKIDRLYIDTEGLDVDIIESIDFNAIEIDYLMFEYIHSDGYLTYGGSKLNNLVEKLKNLNYKISNQEFNVIATK